MYTLHLHAVKIDLVHVNIADCADDMGVQTTPPPRTTVSPLTCSVQCPCPPCPSLCKACSSCSSSTLLAAVISVITTALLATGIFILVQLIVCKCRPGWFKRRPKQADTVTYTTGERPVHHLEEEEGGAIIMHNPIVDTYMEDEGGGGGGGEGREEEEEGKPTFELEGKEAYIISNSFND